MRLKLLFYVCLFTCTLQAGNDISNKLEALCSSLVDSLPSSVKSARVAVIPFEDKTGNDSYGLSTSEYLVVILKKKNIFSLINRTEFKKVVEEINLSRSDYADETSVIEVGKVLAADYILTGSVFKSRKSLNHKNHSPDSVLKGEVWSQSERSAKRISYTSAREAVLVIF